MKILKLTIHKQYFDAILRGDKKEEYRQIKKYYFKLHNNKYDFIEFTNGYSSKSPWMKVECKGIEIGEIFVDLFSGMQSVFIIKLGDIVDKKNIKL